MSAQHASRGLDLLYLDLDGTLHTHDVFFTSQGPVLGPNSEGHTLLEHAGLLVELLAPYPQVNIVLSTAWVGRFGFSIVKHLLPEALRCRVIGATFDPQRHTVAYAHVARGYQVAADVAERAPRSWLAVDDDVKDWPDEYRAHVVATDPVLGISEPMGRARLVRALEQAFGPDL